MGLFGHSFRAYQYISVPLWRAHTRTHAHAPADICMRDIISSIAHAHTHTYTHTYITYTRTHTHLQTHIHTQHLPSWVTWFHQFCIVLRFNAHTIWTTHTPTQARTRTRTHAHAYTARGVPLRVDGVQTMSSWIIESVTHTHTHKAPHAHAYTAHELAPLPPNTRTHSLTHTHTHTHTHNYTHHAYNTHKTNTHTKHTHTHFLSWKVEGPQRVSARWYSLWIVEFVTHISTTHSRTPKHLKSGGTSETPPDLINHLCSLTIK